MNILRKTILLFLCCFICCHVFVFPSFASDPGPQPGYDYDYPFTDGDTLEFTIEIYDDLTPSVSYTLTGNPHSLVLGDMVDDRITFDGGDLGICSFVCSNDRVALRVGMTAGGDYTAQYYLANEIYYIDTEMVLTPGTYRAVRLCTDEMHELTVVSETKVTCTENGERVWKCAFCDVTNTEITAALGHDRNMFGTCKRCGNNSVADAWNDFWHGSDDGSGSSGSSGEDGSTETKGGFFDWLQDLFSPDEPSKDETDWFTDFTVKLDTLGNAILVICLGIVGIFFLPYVLKFIKWVLCGIFDALESIVDLFDDVFKSKKKSGRKHAR